MKTIITVAALFLALTAQAAFEDIDFIGDLVIMYRTDGSRCTVDVGHLLKDEASTQDIVQYVRLVCGM